MRKTSHQLILAQDVACAKLSFASVLESWLHSRAVGAAAQLCYLITRNGLSTSSIDSKSCEYDTLHARGKPSAIWIRWAAWAGRVHRSLPSGCVFGMLHYVRMQHDLRGLLASMLNHSGPPLSQRYMQRLLHFMMGCHR